MVISGIGYVKQNYENFISEKEKKPQGESVYEKMSRELSAWQEEEEENQTGEEIKPGKTEVIRGGRLKLHLSGEDKKAPYYYLSNEGIIDYNGVVFVCDTEKNQLQLGDVSDKTKCLTIPLADGGALVVNRDNLGDLSKAIGMFSPEDVNRILRAIHQDTKVKQVMAEIEDEEGRIGEELKNM